MDSLKVCYMYIGIARQALPRDLQLEVASWTETWWKPIRAVEAQEACSREAWDREWLAGVLACYNQVPQPLAPPWLIDWAASEWDSDSDAEG